MNTYSLCFLIVSFISRFLFVPWVCWCCCCCRFFIVRRAPYFEHRFSSELCLSLYEAHNPYTLRRCRKLYEKQHQIRTHFIYSFIYCILLRFQRKKDHLMCEYGHRTIVATNFTAHRATDTNAMCAQSANV